MSDALSSIVDHFNQLNRQTQPQEWAKIRDELLTKEDRQDFYHPRWGVVQAYKENDAWSIELSPDDQALSNAPQLGVSADGQKIIAALRDIFEGQGAMWSTSVRQQTLAKITSSSLYQNALPELLNSLSFHVRPANLQSADSHDDSQYQQVVVSSSNLGPSVASFIMKSTPQLSLLREETITDDAGDPIDPVFTVQKPMSYDKLIDQLILAGLSYNHKKCFTCGNNWETLCQSSGIDVNSPATDKSVSQFLKLVSPLANENLWGSNYSYVSDNMDAIKSSPQWAWALAHIIKGCEVESADGPNDDANESLVFFKLPHGSALIVRSELEQKCPYLDFDDESAQEISEEDDLLAAMANHPTWTVADMLNDLSNMGFVTAQQNPAPAMAPAAPVAVPKVFPLPANLPPGLAAMIGPPGPDDEDEEDYEDEDGYEPDEASQAITSGKLYQLEQLIASGWDPRDGGRAALSSSVSLNNGEAWRTLLSSSLTLEVPDNLVKTLVGTSPDPTHSYDGFIKPLLEHRMGSMSPLAMAELVAWQMRIPPAKVIARQQQFLRQQLMNNLSPQDYNDVLILASLNESKGWLVKPWAQDLANALATDPRGAQYLVNQAIHHALANNSYASIKEIVKSSQIRPSAINVGGQNLLDVVKDMEKPQPTSGHQNSQHHAAMYDIFSLMGGGGAGSSQARINQRKMFIQSIKMLENQIAAKQKASSPKV